MGIANCVQLSMYASKSHSSLAVLRPGSTTSEVNDLEAEHKAAQKHARRHIHDSSAGCTPSQYCSTGYINRYSNQRRRKASTCAAIPPRHQSRQQQPHDHSTPAGEATKHAGTQQRQPLVTTCTKSTKLAWVKEGSKLRVSNLLGSASPIRDVRCDWSRSGTSITKLDVTFCTKAFL